jgi:DNA-binding transcriptional MerR regulator
MPVTTQPEPVVVPDGGALAEDVAAAGAAATSRSPLAAESVGEAGIRISDAAARVGVSARTLRYYEELGLLAPSLYTSGGERRYTLDDLEHLQRILELREVLGMNLDEIREFLALETRLDELRATYRAAKGATTKKAQAEQRATLQEAMVLNESLAQQISTKLERMDGFRAKLLKDAERCRELLTELD